MLAMMRPKAVERAADGLLAARSRETSASLAGSDQRS
jgi:hypothetical protein